MSLNCHKVNIDFSIAGCWRHWMRVYEIAPVSICAKSFMKVSSARPCLISAVSLIIFLQFLQSMRKFTSLLVGAVPVFHEFFAKLWFLLIVSVVVWVLSGRLFSGKGVVEMLGIIERERKLGSIIVKFAHFFLDKYY